MPFGSTLGSEQISHVGAPVVSLNQLFLPLSPRALCPLSSSPPNHPSSRPRRWSPSNHCGAHVYRYKPTTNESPLVPPLPSPFKTPPLSPFPTVAAPSATGASQGPTRLAAEALRPPCATSRPAPISRNHESLR